MKTYFKNLRRKIFGPTLAERLTELEGDYERLANSLQAVDVQLKKAMAHHEQLPEGHECKEKLMKVIHHNEIHHKLLSTCMAEIAIQLSIVRTTLYAKNGGIA